MHTRDECKNHIAVVDTIWNEAFDSSLEHQSEGRMQFIFDLCNQYAISTYNTVMPQR